MSPPRIPRGRPRQTFAHYERAKKLRELGRPAVAFGYYDHLSDVHRRFVDEYLVDLNGFAAAVRAGYKGSTAYNLLDRDDVQRAIKERRDLADGDRSASGARFVLNKLWDVATADPRDLVEIRKVPCRYCWGTNGQYQFTKTEMDRMLKAYEYGRADRPFSALWPRSEADFAAHEAGRANLPFDPQGGEGYTTSRSPNEACTECGGYGVTVQVVHDTRRLTGAAQSLYRGATWSPRDGKFEIKMANQDAARDMLARHYNVAVERKEMLVKVADPKTLSDDELTQAIAELEAITLSRDDYQEVKDKPLLKRIGRPT
jgi:hypothetical protein